MGSLTKRSQATFLCLILLAAAPAAAQQRMYKCVDAKGKTYYTQVPPPECLGRDTQELNKSGSLIREPGRNPVNPRAGAGARSRAQEETRGRREIQGGAP